ncbi:Hypothetical_protein [Hexamita inflata]|uniref:Hypothetical_protein n=1 Tax=Hexamita inflata TaxID=28002 RepID=A0AA86QZE4_9EUKA|nr:Hypothetical protein HINF_LOCUS50169 [Hexamita inflata]
MLGCKFLLAELSSFILFLALCRVSNIPPGNLSWLPWQILGVVLGCVLPGALCGACWLGCGCWLGCAGLVCSVWAAWWCSVPWLFSVSRFSLFTVFHFSQRDLRLMLVSGVPGLVSGREVGVLALWKQVLRNFVKKQGKVGFRLELACTSHTLEGSFAA